MDIKLVVGPPTGTVTFLFTDIEGSTRLWERDAEAMQVARHDAILHRVIEEREGYVFKTVGDSFSTATYALEVQRALLAEELGIEGGVRVRVALSTGAAEERDGDYFGTPINRVARLLSARHGGRRSCGARRRPYKKRRACPGTPTGSPRPTPASTRCAQSWAKRRGRRLGGRVGR